jgi:CRISPR/Cas system CSM-associated protein Csm5 (group 7 of RAMP superfamily)
MGIFGFLSKSHIEQEAGSSQQISQINLLNNKIESIESKKLSLTQRKQNNNQLKEEDFNLLSRLNDRLNLLDDAVSEVRSKGGFSVNSKLKELSDLQSEERLSITNQKNDIQSRLDQYRVRNEEQIFPELSKLEEELLSINVSKTKLESELKKLEAEIGPIKYIAEIISDFGGPQVDAQAAVRIVILILIFVFDPLAILLVVAASATFKEATGQALPKDVVDMRNKILSELEMHLAEGKSAESFLERYKI